MSKRINQVQNTNSSLYRRTSHWNIVFIHQFLFNRFIEFDFFFEKIVTMAKNMNGMSIDELPGDLIKEELQRIVKHRLGSEDYEICIEPASKKGKRNLNILFQC